MSYPYPSGNPPYPTGSYPGANPTPSCGFAPGVTGNPTQGGYPSFPTSNPPYPSGAPSMSYPTASWGSAPNTGMPSYPYPSQPTGQPSSYPSQPTGLPSSYPGSAPGGVYPNLGAGGGAGGGSYPASSYPTSSSPAGGGYPQYSAYPGSSAPGSVPPNPSYPGSSAPGSGPPNPSYPTQQQFPSQQQQYQSVPGGYPTQAGYPGSQSSPYGSGSPLPKSPQHTMTANNGTVREHQPFHPEEDSKVLRKAMKGFGTDEKAIIDILAHRTNAQRQHIYVTYKTHFGRDLTSDLKSELGGKFEDVILAMMTPTADFLAQQLHKSIAGIGTDESAIIEILCPRTNHEIREINAAYQRLYKKPLEKHLIEDTSGHFRKLLVSLCMANRDENPSVDHGRAAADAQALFQAGAAQWGTDESVFNSVLLSRSYPHLRQVFEEYQRQTGRSIDQSVKGEFSGDVEDGLLALVKCAKNIPGYFAERLYRSMVGAGTNDRALIRIIVTRCEIDMVYIKQEFQHMYGKTLESFVAGDTSGDYKKVLLALIQ